MKFAGKIFVVATSFAFMAAAAAAVRTTGTMSHVLQVVVPAAKDQARVPFDADLGIKEDYGANFVQLAQPTPPPSGHPGPLDPPPARDGGPYGAGPAYHFGPPGLGERPFGTFAGPPGLFAAGVPFDAMAPNRLACEEDIDGHAAVAGYLKSKLNLQGSQKEAWLKIEQAVDPVVEKMHQACTSLPTEPDVRPTFPVMIELADKQLSLRAEFVQAISGPAVALYEILSPDQRSILDRPPRRPF
jgi:hypothetical protein